MSVRKTPRLRPADSLGPAIPVGGRRLIFDRPPHLDSLVCCQVCGWLGTFDELRRNDAGTYCKVCGEETRLERAE